MPAVSCRLTALLLAAAVACVPLAPPEHVHEGHDDHHGPLVHRHAEVHVFTEQVHHHGAVLDDDDGAVVTLTAAFTLPSPLVLPAPATANVLLPFDPSPGEPLRRAAAFVELLIHGPPRAPASLRAPPPSLVL